MLILGKLSYNLDSKTYNGQEQGITVNKAEEIGTVTVKYNGSTDVAKNAGTYEITVDIATKW